MQLSKELFTKLKETVSFFSNFTDGELIALLKLAISETYNDGEIVFKENTRGDKMYIILSGTVRISKKVGKNKEEVLVKFGQGACFGEMGIINQSPRTASAIVEGGNAILLVFKESVLSQSNLLLAFKLYKNFAIKLADDLKKTNEKLLSAAAGDRDTNAQMKALLKKRVEKGQSFKGADLRGADLSGMFMNNANMQDTIFIGAKLNDTKCKQTNFKGANFVNSSLEEITFDRADFSGADFSGAKFSDVDFRSCNMSNAKFNGADISDSYRWNEESRPNENAPPKGYKKS